ncbi:hypothetical protein K1719_031302 [Acacia pycnantha]|nr:hypothetical protein K1719_031302 [Acacia pycnantha]
MVCDRTFNQWSTGGADRDGTIRKYDASHGGKFMGAVHGREGDQARREAVALQGIEFPPRDPEIYVPGQGFHETEIQRLKATQKISVMETAAK